ncbi:MAG: class I SAM-dependent methyltransferase [Roseibium sp.]
MSSSTFSKGLHSETEKPGEAFPLETQSIIRDRYEFSASLCQGNRVLEIGSGSGFAINYLSGEFSSLTCLEFSNENYDALKTKKQANVDIHLGDAHEMPFSDQSFDSVIALAMIYYLDLEKFLSEVRRVLVPAGTLIFCTSNKDVPGFVAAPFTTRYYSIPEMAKILSNAGYQPRFYGAFPASSGSLRVRQLKASLKNVAKFGIQKLPFGPKIWSKMRKSTLLDVCPLPDSISVMPPYEGDRIRLPENIPNTLYRVIYVVAESESL